MHVHVYQETEKRVPTEVLSIIARKLLFSQRTINKSWFIQTRGYFSAANRDELQIHVMM